MAALSNGCCATPSHPVDTLATPGGRELRIVFYKHASLAFEIEGRRIYLDPVGDFADYASQPKADLILITHHHSDHFDPQAAAALSKSDTRIVCDRTTAELILSQGGTCTAVRPGERFEPFDFLTVETAAAYNTTEGHLQFHPREREDVGYLLEYDGLRIYIAGDSENTPEMKGQKAVDVAMLPVNQPYTMTVGQAVDAVKAIRPRIFYPIHYGQVEERTDLDRLQRELEGVTEVRIRGME